MESDKRYDNIIEYMIKPFFLYSGNDKAYCTNTLKGSTEEIRSCTAGLVIDDNREIPLFFA